MADSSPGRVDDEDSVARARHITNAASHHDIKALRQLIDTYAFAECKAVDVQDPSTGYTPLHAAIASCSGPFTGEGQDVKSEAPDAAENCVRFLLEYGAIWNQLDHKDMTPGCIAHQLGYATLYEVMVDAGVRAEMLLNRLDEYDQLDGEDEEEVEEGEEGEEEDDMGQQPPNGHQQSNHPEIVVSSVSKDSNATANTSKPVNGLPEHAWPEPSAKGPEDATAITYLSSALSMSDAKILDEQQNGVMMAWEKDIMSKSANAILPSPGLRVLNVGFGMGIIDTLIQSHRNQPAEHHIIEAHPDVLKEMENKGWLCKPGVFVHAGKWQDILPTMANDGLVFDGIYYDTFAESYKEFKEFFSEHVLALLDASGKWSYFNGMGADRQISYDVYQKIVEMDLLEAGYDVDWEDVELPDLRGEWEGVRRKYWNVERYRLPVCRFLD